MKQYIIFEIEKGEWAEKPWKDIIESTNPIYWVFSEKDLEKIPMGLRGVDRNEVRKMEKMKCPQCDFKIAARMPLSVMEKHIEENHPYWLG